MIRLVGRLFCAVLCLVLFTSYPAQAYNFKNSYSHYSDSEPLGAVLQDFARVQGLNSQVSSAVTGKLSGMFQSQSPKKFLEGMRAAFGVRYYVLSGTVYFYNETEWQQTLIRPVNLSSAALKNTLERAGFVSPDLPLQDKGGVLVVEGPPSYLDSVSAMAANLDNSPQVKQVMRVFRLKHAKADDTEVNSMSRTVVVPGVASILNRMVTGGSQQGLGPMISVKPATVQKLRGSGLISQGGSNNNSGTQKGTGNSAAQDGEAAAEQQAPSIVADTRLNAVLVHDYEYRMPFYSRVISDLDQPVKLVELHAAIVDIDINAARDVGIDWQGGISRGNWNIGGGVGNSSNLSSFNGATGLPLSNSDNGGIFSTVFSSTHGAFMATVNMLESASRARTLGRPSVLTQDNMEATLEDTTTLYVKVAGNEDVDLFKVESGTVLQVTPHIIEDEEGGKPFISMVVNLQSNSGDNSSFSISTSGEVPPVKQTKISTRALVREGQSLLLGGLFVEYQKVSGDGVPGARDVAVVGKLFGRDSDSSYRQERFFLITPRVLNVDEVQNMPQNLDDEQFVMSPTQDNYLKRPARPKKESGCSSNRTREEILSD
ncbi:MAG: type III secretion system outer membrane ring subunit SctC [Succinivibrio sp.]|nr:type III secretion system outer membrane ring subunit SctC [Succinivibrio sp.]